MSYVQVLDRDDQVVRLSDKRDGIFYSINEAIKNILICNNYDLYKIKLFGDFFDEYVKIPIGISLRFTSPNRCRIRAIKTEHTQHCFENNITIDHVIDGDIKPRADLRFIEPTESFIQLYEKIKAENPEIINAALANNFFNKFKDTESDINRMLLLLEEKTMNLQILLLTRALKEDIHFLSMKMDNLALTNDEFDGYWEYRLRGTRKFQELLEKFITQPKQKVYKINRYIDTENLLTTTEFDDIKSIIEINSKEYRQFIYNVLFRIQELLSAYNYSLDKFTDYLKENDDSYLLYCLQPLNKQFKTISIGFDALSRYIHGLGDNNQFIINGINSSINLLELTEKNINGIHGTEFKETLITFLNKNKKPEKRLKLDSSNQEVINALRKFSKNCPDADYKLIRYVSDHPQEFKVISIFLSAIPLIGSTIGIINTFFPFNHQ